MNKTLQIIFLLIFISNSGFSQSTKSVFKDGLLVLNTPESKKSTKGSGTTKEVHLSTLDENSQATKTQTPINQETTTQTTVKPIETDEVASTQTAIVPIQEVQAAANIDQSKNTDIITAPLLIQQEEVGVIFYPNPVRDNLTVQFPQRGTHTVKVFNIIGEKVAEKTVVDEDIVSMNLSNIQPGVLFLSYEYAGKVYTKKFSKN